MNDSDTIKIKGCLEKILFRNPDNNYFIGKMICEDDNKSITLVGQTFEIKPGERINVSGKWVNNKKYGLQFEVSNLEVLVPLSIEGLQKYLGSGLIKGIGPIMAKRIVKKFGLDTLMMLDENPEKLVEIDGFADKRIELIKNEWRKQKYIREIMIFMQSYGISNNYALKIYNIYGTEAINVLKSNPYKLIEDVWGIGFKIADGIAESLGIQKDSTFRIKSGVLYLLNEITDAGNCYYPYEDFLKTSVSLLDVGEASIIEAVEKLIDEKKLILTGQTTKKIYLKSIYDDEIFVAKKLLEVRDTVENQKNRKNIDNEKRYNPLNLDESPGNNFLPEGELETKIKSIAGKINLELDDIQMEAIKAALFEKLIIITGSPGTGKSTILNIIINFLKNNSAIVMMAAPTGRAAKRLEQATGYEAKTIHRLLKFQPKLNRFLKNEEDKLHADVVIIDEASMLDIRLFKSLLNATDPKTKLILVGDVDQLPAVGPGNVLSDIINSNAFKVIRLERIYRQGGKSQIIYNAHRIRDGIYPIINNSKYNDFYFIEKIDPEQTVDSVIELAVEKIPSSFNYKSIDDIQVLVPTNKGVVGVNNLNNKIQEKINKTNIFFNKGMMRLGINDKVIQLKNNYEKEVFNGDIGYIRKIDFEMQEIYVDYDGRIVQYDFHDTDQISLSYAISIHKSQGSEFKCVIIPILTSHYLLLQRNLLYTAITRAKELAVLVGSKKAIGMAVNRNIVEKRYTGLKDLLIKDGF